MCPDPVVSLGARLSHGGSLNKNQNDARFGNTEGIFPGGFLAHSMPFHIRKKTIFLSLFQRLITPMKISCVQSNFRGDGVGVTMKEASNKVMGGGWGP